MPLPRGVIKEIIGVCRAFLWKSRDTFEGPGLVAWDKMCKPKASGGLGLREIGKWNKAALFKHVWAVEWKKDNL